MHKTRIIRMLAQPNKASSAIHAQFGQPFQKITVIDVVEAQKYHHIDSGCIKPFQPPAIAFQI